MKYRILSFALAATFILFAFSACSQGDTEYVNSGIVEIEGLDGFSIIENPVYPDYSDAEINHSESRIGYTSVENMEEILRRGVENDNRHNVVIARVKRKNTTAYQRNLEELRALSADEEEAQRRLKATSFILTEVEILEIYDQTFKDKAYEVAVGDTLIIKESNLFAKSEDALTEKKAAYFPEHFPVQPGEHIMFLTLRTDPLRVGSEEIGITYLPGVWLFQHFPLDINQKGSVHTDHLHQDVLDKYVNKTYVAPVSSVLDEK
ncbi:MAG: hypothetical protein IJY82_07255 [Oscillospiraceae bacterium]|nr:hypothetical protein [Oscillospiraceae bacterium]